MSADAMAVTLVALMAFPATMFPIIFGLTGPWWRTLVGRALMTKSVGLALLIDISLLYTIFGDDYAARDAVRLGVYGFILAGVWLQFIALVVEKRRALRK